MHRCVFNEPPPPRAVPSCSQAGSWAPWQGWWVFASDGSPESLLGLDGLLTDTLLVWNALRMDFRKVKVTRNPRCAVCGEHPTITTLRDEAAAVCDITGSRDECAGDPRFDLPGTVEPGPQAGAHRSVRHPGGRGDRVEVFHPMTNTDHSADHFLMEPAEQFKVIKSFACGRSARAGDSSQPSCFPSRPSAEDIRLALTPDVLYTFCRCKDQQTRC